MTIRNRPSGATRNCPVTLAWLLAVALAADPLAPGDHTRTLRVDGWERSYLVHVPPKYDPKRPTPVVLIFHGAMTNAPIMVAFCGMSQKADEAGFVAVYPDGTGTANLFLTWNSGGFHLPNADKRPDDVKFVSMLLDDLATVVSIDLKQVYASGLSNGGMMCYRLAAELSDRIAAIAPVSGTMAVEEYKPKRPVPIMHFHGTADAIVPFNGPGKDTPKFLTFKSVEETIRTCAKANSCPETPTQEDLPDKADDGTKVKMKTYGPAKDGAEVVLFEIEGGGHTWPGRDPLVRFLGKSSKDISANDLIWEFFQKHPMK
jgi:polyhydroxybutyrate depolymerase